MFLDILENENVKNYFKGFIVGSVQTIIGHPFDTIKTNIQTNKKINVLKLNRGIFFPLISNSFINSILFGSHNYCNNYTTNYMLSGMISGIIISPIVTPIDKLKIEYQLNKKNKNNINLTNLFRDLQVTMIRESFATGIYFYSYHNLKKMNILRVK